MQDDTNQPTNQYRNPVDGKTYVTNGQWQDYQPQNPQPAAQDGKVVLDHVRLLTDQTTVSANLSTEQLSQFIKDITSTITNTLSSTSASFQVMIQFELSPTEPVKVQLANQGDASNEILQSIYSAVISTMAPKPTSDPIALLLQFNVNAEA